MVRAWLVLLLLLLPSSSSSDELLSAEEIVVRAHQAAGGEEWLRPETLYLSGTVTFFEGRSPNHMERYEMWRVYAKQKSSAHEASGKVRIRALQQGVVQLDIAFDGTTTYVDGLPTDDKSSGERWASNFGFGAIRHVFDPRYSLARLADDQVDGAASFNILVTDPQGGETLFGIAQKDYSILKVGFRTPRGWHERIYSHFFIQPGGKWKQPGRIRLYYDGIKQNEVQWTRFIVNQPIDSSVFDFSHP